MKQFVFVIFSLCLVFTGCVSRFMPVEQGNIQVINEFAVLMTEQETLAVRVDLWNGEPQYLTEYFDIMFVRLQNRTTTGLSVEPSDFILIDQNGMQYDLVPSDIVLEIALAHPSLIPERFNISSDTQRESLNRIASIRRNIMTRAFVFGDIHHGAFKEGLLFFPKIDSRSQEFTIVYKNNEILFRRNR